MSQQPATTISLLSHCKSFLSNQKLSLNSRKLYLADIKRFLTWLPSSSITPSNLSNPGLYQDYLSHLQDNSLSPSMIKRTTASLRQLGAIINSLYSLGNPTLLLSQSTNKTPDINHQVPFSNHLKHFTNYLTLEHLSPSTIKSYKSDITRYIKWAHQSNPSTKINQLLTTKNIQKYLNYLSESDKYPASTCTRKQASLTRFQSWYLSSYPSRKLPDKIKSTLSNLPTQLTQTSPEGAGSPNSHFHTNLITARQPLLTWSNTLSLGLILLLVTSLGYFGYRAFSRDQVLLSQAYPSTPATPNRQLSFQGRLEDSGGTPITTSTNLVFKLFDASTVGSELYSTGTCAITPDSDGVFSTQIGSTCGSGIDSSVFSENADVWLEVTVDSEVLDPRQQIATVAYALNSETLQGIPISATMSAIANSVVPMNSGGEIIIGEQSPTMRAVSGTFSISAPALSITTATGSSGNISIAPDGTGQVNILGNTTSTNFFNVSNAQLTTGSLITGTVANSNTDYLLLDLLSGTSPTSVFSVADNGDTTMAGDLTISGDDLFMDTNTANYFLMADGTNYNPTSPADARTGLGLTAGETGDIWVEKAGDTMTGQLLVDLGSDTEGIIIQGDASQTANLLETQDSSSNVLSGIDERGVLFSHGSTSDTGVYLGSNAGNMSSTGIRNIGIGSSSLDALTTASSNTAIGNNSLGKNETGNSNIGIGIYTLSENISNSSNIAIGNYSLQNNTASSNVGIGDSTLKYQTSGNYNVGIGASAGYYNVIGDRNTLIGYQAGYGASGNSNGNNTFIGYQAGLAITNGYSNIFVGRSAGGKQTSLSNLLIIDNQERADAATELTNSILYGVMAATPGSQTLRINAVPSINGAYTLPIVDGTTNYVLTTDGAGVASWAAQSGGSSLFTDGGDVTYLTSETDDLALGGTAAGAPLFFDEGAELLTLTNTTAGDSFRVNDVASDTTPFIIDADGNVGIGTTNPLFLLDVAGTASVNSLNINDAYTLPTADGTTDYVLATDGAGNVSWAAQAAGVTADSLDYIDFEDTMDLDANLILNQGSYTWTQNFTGTTDTGYTYNANSLTSGSGISLASTATAFTGDLQSITLSGSHADNTGSLLAIDNTGLLNTNTSLYIKHYATGTGNLAFRVDDESGDTTPFVIDGDGNVGIGVADPSSKLEIGGSTSTISNDSGDITINAASDFISLAGDSLGNLLDLSVAGDASVSGSLAFDGASPNTIDILNGNQLDFQTSVGGDVGLATVMSILNNGDIYISDGLSLYETAVSDGTIEATQFCTGDGETNCVTDFSTLGGGLFTDGGDVTYLTSETDDLALGGTAAGAPLFFDEGNELLTLTNTTAGDSFRVNDVASDTTPFIIDADGNVGIGTTAPARKLEILDGSNPQLRLSNTATDYVDFKSAGSGNLTINTYDGTDTGTFSINGESWGDSISFGSADTKRALLSLTGGATGQTHGGILRLYNSADHDTTIDYYNIQSSYDDLLIGPSTDIDALAYYGGTGDWSFTAGNVGIGTTAPSEKLDITGDVYISGGGGTIAGTTLANGWLKLGSSLAMDNNEIYFGVDAYIGTIGAYDIRFQPNGTFAMIIEDGGNVGIGTTAPSEELEVVGDIGASRFLDTANTAYYLDPAATATSLSIDGNILSNGAFTISSNGNNNITLDAGTGTVVIGSSGTGKLDAGTIDPPYSINGDKFATYLSGMTGVKEETTGTVNTSEYIEGYGYRTTLNLATAPQGSDLWLFREITNLHEQFDQLVVLLSPNSNTRAWYQLHPDSGIIEIYSTQPSKVGYRLTAPRFDADTWTNTRDSASLGFVLDGQPNWDQTSDPDLPTPTNYLSEIFHSVATTIAQITSLETNLISPLDDSQPLTITTNTIITPQDPTLPTLTIDGEIQASSISARIARLEELDVDTLRAGNIIADSITAGSIEGLDAKIASLSAGSTTKLSDNDLETITDRIKARLAEISSPTAADLTTPPEATSSPTPLPNTDYTTPIASDSATLTSLDADMVFINDYLAVIGSATITNLDITDHFYTNSIISKSNTLALQPTGGIINLANNTLIVNSTGQVMVNGDLTVSGKIIADSAQLNSLSLGTPPAPSEAEGEVGSQLGQLLAVYNESGEAVATIDASGSASFRDLSTQLITIAAPSDSTQSASTSALAAALGISSTSNATAGEATLITPNTELTIESRFITPNTLVYLTPVSNTDNKVLFVSSKETCPPPPEGVSMVLTPCTRSFTVAIDSPANTNIDFNWWVIQLQTESSHEM